MFMMYSLYKYSSNKNAIGKTLINNMVITIEPGIYFIKELIYKYDGLFNENIIKYFHIGGVRIEDDILVTSDGYEQLNNVVR